MLFNNHSDWTLIHTPQRTLRGRNDTIFFVFVLAFFPSVLGLISKMMDYPRNELWNNVVRNRKLQGLSSNVEAQKRKSPTSWDLFSDYTNASTVHGFKYMGEKNRSWFERIFWMLGFMISFCACGQAIYNVWRNWDHNPVIVTFADRPTPIWQIPFPAITICPEIKTKKEVMDITKTYHMLKHNHSYFSNLAPEDQAVLTAISQVCLPTLSDAIDPESVTECSKCIETLRVIGIPKENMFQLCEYRKNLDTCNELFEEVVTEEGICYTFNGLSVLERESYRYDTHVVLPPINWSLEAGYRPTDPFETYPRRGLGSGMRFGLYTLLNLCKEEYDYVCRGPVQGFKLLLHIPTEVPQLSKHFYRIPLEEEVLVVVKPQMMTTSEGLRHYSPEKRKCYFNDERKLRHFLLYTQRNCELECLTNFTLKKCDCIKFNMPRIPGVKICGINEIQCTVNAEYELLQNEIEQELGENQRTNCNCLPSCFSLTYEAEISQSSFDTDSFFEAHRYGINMNSCKFTRLIVVFKEDQLITLKRSEFLKGTDFLANCGGLLGLFLGVSFMSILEIFYFCTVRLYCNLKTQQKVLAKPPIIWVNSVSKSPDWR